MYELLFTFMNSLSTWCSGNWLGGAIINQKMKGQIEVAMKLNIQVCLYWHWNAHRALCEDLNWQTCRISECYGGLGLEKKIRMPTESRMQEWILYFNS